MTKTPAKSTTPKTARLMYGNGADWFYATGIRASDPALWFCDSKGRTHLPVSERDVAEYMAFARADVIIGWPQIRAELKKADQPFNMVNVVKWLLAKDKAAEVVEVPRDFPAGFYLQLVEAGVPLRVGEGPFFTTRAIKTADEIKKMAAAQRANERGMEHAFGILRACKIGKDKRLRWQGSVLTSEALGQEINAFLLRQGCVGFNGGPIVGCGVYGAMPHGGHGPLRAHELIVMDSFPTHRNGYCGDLTRTVAKGKPTDWQRMIYGTVLEAQKLALGLIKPGVNGAEIHKAVGRFFEQAGFPVGADIKGRPQGFFHGLGHSVGLDLHDGSPTLGGQDVTLRPGMVTSVEPGLYYPAACALNGIKGGPGGCRIEDVVVVTAGGYRNLTKLSKTAWIIP